MAALDPISLVNSVHQEEVKRVSLSLMMQVGMPLSLHQLSTKSRAMRFDELVLFPNFRGTSLTILVYLSVMVITASWPWWERGSPVTKSTEMVPNRRPWGWNWVHDALFGVPATLVMLAWNAFSAVLHYVSSYSWPPKSSGQSLVRFGASQVSCCRAGV